MKEFIEKLNEAFQALSKVLNEYPELIPAINQLHDHPDFKKLDKYAQNIIRGILIDLIMNKKQ
jgi:transcription termination factor NusB